MQKKEPNIDLDLSGQYCPMAFVKSRVFLEQCSTGEIVSIAFENSKANEPLIRSIESLRHKIVSRTTTLDPDKKTISAPLSNNLSPNDTVQLICIEVQVKSKDH